MGREERTGKPEKSATSILIIDDGRAGHLHQSEALSKALIRATSSSSAAMAALNSRSVCLSLAVASRLQALTAPTWLIGCGRRCAAVSAELKGRFGAKLNSIQILNPVASPERMRTAWDWLLIPEHDQVSGDNVVSFLGALVTPPPAYSGPVGHLLLLLGAATDYLPWNESSLNSWLDQAATQNLPVSLCPSRRTPTNILQILQTRCDQHPGWQWINPDDPLAYRQALSRAIEFWVSADSINMLAEAVASDRPLRALGAGQARGKLKWYLQQLALRHRFSVAEPIVEVDRVTAELLKRGALSGLNLM